MLVVLSTSYINTDNLRGLRYGYNHSVMSVSWMIGQQISSHSAIKRPFVFDAKLSRGGFECRDIPKSGQWVKAEDD